MMVSKILFVFSLLIFCSVNATFHPDFKEFLIKTYGKEVANQLERNDLGTKKIGSFGGGPSNSRIRPVILVHGLDSDAGSYAEAREKFHKADRIPSERIFATTYGPGMSPVVITSAMSESMKCGYVIHVRRMIDAVHRYYNTEVDIVAYSMGSPLARKAILGGKCVDADIDMGEALTGLVHTFVSVAGANRGSYICEIPLLGACNLINGLHCHSKFMDDINNQYYYEGAKVYNIYSDTDPIIGLYTCGYQSTAISGAQDIKLSGLTHKGTMFDTFQRQAQLLMQENQVTLAEDKKEVAALKLADKELTNARISFQRDQAQFNNENRRYARAYSRWLDRLASADNYEQYGDFKHALKRASAQNRQLNRRLRSIRENNKSGRKHETDVQRYARLIREGNKHTRKLWRELKRLQHLNTQSQQRINKIKRANKIMKRRELIMQRRLQRQQELQRTYKKRFHTYPANLSKSIHFETTTGKPDNNSLIISMRAGETPEDPALRDKRKEKDPQIITNKIPPQKIKELVSQLATEVEKESQASNTTAIIKSKFVPDMQSLNTDN